VRFVLRDHDAKFSRSFDDVFRSQGGEVLVTPVRSPKANAYAERWIRTVRAECLDWLLIVGRNHLDQVLRVYFSITTVTGPTAHSGCKRQIRRPGRPSPRRIMEARCIDATCSAVCFTSTGEVHERVCARFTFMEHSRHDQAINRRFTDTEEVRGSISRQRSSGWRRRIPPGWHESLTGRWSGTHTSSAPTTRSPALRSTSR
jgi:hypothetical protein